nr:SMC-Scp complex subunit ScpB [Flaviflexus massiliensis]
MLGALEAILMVVPEPVSVRHLSDVLGLSEAIIDKHLRSLAAEYRGENGRRRGFDLREVGEGWRIYSSPAYAEVVGSFVTHGQTGKLSGPALETLAVIAYRQPVTRSQIAEIRGVNVDGVVRTLTTRGLVEATGQEGTGAVLYGTTGYFLEKMGMTSLAELPPASPHLPELDELDEIEKDRQ